MAVRFTRATTDQLHTQLAGSQPVVDTKLWASDTVENFVQTKTDRLFFVFTQETKFAQLVEYDNHH
jgi:hypothetical protein